MSAQREGFLSALALNEDDRAARLAYSDWLEENGEYEEADRQRKWKAAKDRIMALIPPDSPIGYRMLMDCARQAVGKVVFRRWRDPSFEQDPVLMKNIAENREIFWEAWEIVVGIPLPDDEDEDGSYYRSCSC